MRKDLERVLPSVRLPIKEEKTTGTKQRTAAISAKGE
jgi:hypothetical protein